MPTSDRQADARITPGVQTYRELASDYDGSRYVGAVNERKEQYRRDALEGLMPAHIERALDVACGTARGVLILKERARTAVGVDGTLEMLQEGKRKDQSLRLAQSNAAHLPFKDGAFDVVTCLNFVHLFDDVRDKKTFVSEIGRVLRPGGTAIVEFDNALSGVVIGGLRKTFGKDIGYDWPWVMRRCFDPARFRIQAVSGANVPFAWRVPGGQWLESNARHFPLNQFANRTFIAARRL